MTIGTPLLWAGFLGFVLVMLALDLFVFHRKAHAVSLKEAGAWSGVWVGLALLFAGGLAWRFGGTVATDFLTGYVIEKSLSLDNIFVFVVLFGAFHTPVKHQHRVLVWGILGALAMRAAMIWGGAVLLEHFHWLIYVFGAFLVFTGAKLFLAWRAGDAEVPPTEGTLYRWIRKVVPSTDTLDGGRFFTVANGKRVATPLFLVLLMVEGSDLVFALDSIPAIFAVTEDPFLVFTSNIFAMMGLRSLFFVVADLVTRFRLLKVGLAGVLVFVGGKMGLAHWLPIPPWASLATILGILGVSMLLSLRTPRGGGPRLPVHPHRGQPTTPAAVVD